MRLRSQPTRRVPALTFALLLAAVSFSACAGDTEPSDGAAADTTAADTTAAATAPLTADTVAITVADSGLATPESVLHDPAADVYLVSNVNGAPHEKDDNGFISRVSPDGTVQELKWIDGEAEDVTLNGPKGLAIHGDTLFVADIDSVRAFGRVSGEYYGARGVPGATFLNDLTVGADGTLYVSDSGLAPDFSSNGSDAIYRFEGNEAVAVAQGTDLGSPNGLVAFGGQIVAVGFGGTAVRQLAVGGDAPATAEVIMELPGGQLDGVVRLSDGSFLVSSWENQAIYHLPAEGAGGEVRAVVENMPSPADIGWDAQRRRILIPVFQENRLVFQPFAGAATRPR
jgi:hypothetical protein